MSSLFLFSGKYSLLWSVFLYILKFNRKSLGFWTFLIYLNIAQNYLFLQYHIDIKYTYTIVLLAHEDILMIHSNISNILKTTVNKYQNNRSEWCLSDKKKLSILLKSKVWRKD